MRFTRSRGLRRASSTTLPQKLAAVAVFGFFLVQYVTSWCRRHAEALDHFLSWFVPFSCSLLALGLALAIWLWVRHRRTVRADRNPRLEDLGKPDRNGRNTGKRLEHLAADLMRAEGLEDVEVSGGAGDLGGDVIGYLREDGRRYKVVVQCKEYRRTRRSVPSGDMQKFCGTVWGWPHYADVAVFVTSAQGFDGDAAELAYQNQILTLAYPDLEQVARGERTIIPPARTPQVPQIGGAA